MATLHPLHSSSLEVNDIIKGSPLAQDIMTMIYLASLVLQRSQSDATLLDRAPRTLPKKSDQISASQVEIGLGYKFEAE